MPSPFPGFDPYLESPAEWRNFHQAFIGALSNVLNRQLPPPFVARKDVRLYVVPWDRDIYPDVGVLPVEANPQTRLPGNTVLVAPPPPINTATPPLRLALQEESIHEPFIEIRIAGSANPPIAVIELLSPTNKTTRIGREEYKRKQHDLLQSQTHLLEIDLLRGGNDVIVPPRLFIHERYVRHFDYLICLHRGGSGSLFDLWPFSLRERMPTVLLPLSEEQPDMLLDLQSVFETIYEDERYARTLLYGGEIEPPLSFEDALWADELLRAKGLRKG